MSDEADAKVDIQALTPKQLTELTDDQIRLVKNISTQRMNPEIVKAMRVALEGKESDIVAAFTKPPFAYVGPEVEILPGFNVSFRSLYEDQSYDVQMSARKFMMKEDPSDVVAGMYLNKCFLVHSINTVNGEPFGGISLPDAYVQVAFERPEEAREMLEQMRDKRLRSLGAYPSQMIVKLTDAHQVFQQTMDGLLNNQELKDILGN
jgi:hypothetical protein